MLKPRVPPTMRAQISAQITLSLSDDTYWRAETYAASAERDLSEIIAAALATSLPSVEVIDGLRAMTKLPDAEVVALTELTMDPEADRRLSELPDRQQAGQLSEMERAELAALMRDYEICLLGGRKESGSRTPWAALSLSQ